MVMPRNTQERKGSEAGVGKSENETQREQNRKRSTETGKTYRNRKEAKRGVGMCE